MKKLALVFAVVIAGVTTSFAMAPRAVAASCGAVTTYTIYYDNQIHFGSGYLQLEFHVNAVVGDAYVACLNYGESDIEMSYYTTNGDLVDNTESNIIMEGWVTDLGQNLLFDENHGYSANWFPDGCKYCVNYYNHSPGIPAGVADNGSFTSPWTNESEAIRNGDLASQCDTVFGLTMVDGFNDNVPYVEDTNGKHYAFPIKGITSPDYSGSYQASNCTGG